MMMLETNNLEIAGVMSRWLETALPGAARKRGSPQAARPGPGTR
jgi:hypothetical protein